MPTSSASINQPPAASDRESMTKLSPLRDRWENAYRQGSQPWDTGVVPPEVRTFWSSGIGAPTRLALDIGCGTGTNVAYLSSLGLTVIGFELAYTACSRARQRLLSMPADSRGCVIQADVSSLPLQYVDAGYILDIGCMHTLPAERRTNYAQGIVDSLAVGGYYHLYAHERLGDGSPERGIMPEEVIELFTPALSVLTIVHGKPDPHRSQWYLLRKMS